MFPPLPISCILAFSIVILEAAVDQSYTFFFQFHSCVCCMNSLLGKHGMLPYSTACSPVLPASPCSPEFVVHTQTQALPSAQVYG
jgi:hypothetical protein